MANNILFHILNNNILANPNFKDWLRNLRIVLNFKKFRYVLHVPLPIDSASNATEHEKEVFKI